MRGEKLLKGLSKILVLLVCILMFGDIFKNVFLKNTKLFTISSPLIFPFLVSLVLLTCFIITVVNDFKGYKNNSNKEGSGEETIDEVKTVVIYLVGLLIYVQLLKLLHFQVATFVFMFVVMFTLNQLKEPTSSKVIKAIAASVITVPALYYTFNGIFKVILP